MMQIVLARGRFVPAQFQQTLRHVRTFSHGSHMFSHEDPEVVEKEKQKQHRGETKSPIPEVPGWSQTLASESEAVVKADRHASDDMDELQRQSVRHAAETHAEDHGVEVEELIEEHKVVKKVTKTHAT